MPWRECYQMDERLRFVARVLEGEKMAALCPESEISLASRRRATPGISIRRHIDALADHIVPAYLFSPTAPCVYG